MQLVIFLGAIAAGLGIVAMIAVSRQAEIGYRFYISGLLLVVMWSYGFTRLRFLYATAANVLIIVAYEIVAVGPEQYLASQQGITMFLTYNFFFISANIIGMFTSYVLESYTRTDFMQKRFLEAEHDKSEKLLLNILPGPIAERLKQGERTIADIFPEVSLLFVDIAEFTPLAADISPTRLIFLLNQIFSTFDKLARKYGLEKIKTIGDAYMAAGGLPIPRPDHAEAIAEMALDIQEIIPPFAEAIAEIEKIPPFKRTGNGPLRVRVGIHTGPVVAGVIGINKFSYDLWGDTVSVASRMESQGIDGRIQATAATYERLKDKYVFQERGRISVKGKGDMTTYFLVGRKDKVMSSAEAHLVNRSVLERTHI